MTFLDVFLAVLAGMCIGSMLNRVVKLYRRRRARSMSDLARKYAGTQG